MITMVNLRREHSSVNRYNARMDTKLSGDVHLIPGGKEMIVRVLKTLSDSGIETENNPDIFIREYLQFGIEDARDVRERASSRAFKEKGRAFIVVASQITADAQNALLKTLEEPSGGALFFIIVPSPETLLPTLRSRAQIVSMFEESVEGNIAADEFLASETPERILMLKLLLPKEKEERDVGPIIVFLSSLERALGQVSVEKSKQGLRAIYRARKYIADKGSLLKPLLEQVALLTPKV
jgi:hypothetical protein